MKYPFLILKRTLLILSLFQTISAREPGTLNYWGSVGLGATYLSDFAFSEKVDCGLQLNQAVFQARVVFCQQQQFKGGLLAPKMTPDPYLSDAGLLAGLIFYDGPKVKTFASIGLSSVQGIKRGKLISSEGNDLWATKENYESIKYWGVGMPLEFQFKFTGSTHVAVGFTVLANVNEHASYIGILSTFSAGQFK